MDSDGSTSMITRGGTSEFSLRNDELKMKASWTGDITLDATGNRITSVDDKLEIRIEDADGEEEAQFEDEGRSINIRYWHDGVEQPDSVEKRDAIDALTLRFFRASDVSAPERIKKMLKHGGSKAVLDEIDLLTSDHAAARYIEILTKTATLDGEEIMAVADKASRIEKDSNLGRALTALVEHQKINDVAAVSIINAASSLESDYDKRRLATALADRIPQGSAAVLMSLIKTIENDYDLRLIAESLAENTNLSADDMVALLTITTDEIESDHDIRLILEKVAPRLREPGVGEAWVAAVMNIESDYDKRKALEAGAAHASDDAALLQKLRAVAERIDSSPDREKALAALQ